MEVFDLNLEVFREVYEPAEDSFLLAKYAQTLRGKVLEIGCGCGIASLVCAKANAENEVLGVDLNPAAVENSRLNAKRNGIKNAEFRESDLFSNVRIKAISGNNDDAENEKFDGIMFNPPYLPTSENERMNGKLNLAFDGGKNGRKITNRFLNEFPQFMKKDGTLLMIESSLAGIEKTITKLEKARFRVEILEEEKFFFERIVALRASYAKY